MKNRIFTLGVMAFLFAACSVNEMDIATPVAKDAEEFFAAIEDASTRVFVDDDLMVLWHADDRVSIFNKYTYNQQYRFTGNTGANSGSFTKVPNDDFVTGNALNSVYAIYPYKESTEISNQGVLTIDLPATQSYAENSFGVGANTMVSCSEGNELLFKNLCGYIMLKLYGDNVTVKSISIKGNNDEPLAGKATVNASLESVPTMSFDASATKEITLTFDTPVTLGTTFETATTFWLVVPPTTFSKGITLTVKDDKNGEFKKSSTASLHVGRNTLKRMSALQATPLPSDEPIVFADIIAKYACVEKFDTNGDGEVSYAEAASVTSLNGLFSDWNTITSFEEIRYFTGVTSIDGVFTGLSKLESLTIPDFITTMGSFQTCTALKSIVLPAGITSLPDNCFRGCSSLDNIVLPSGVTSLGTCCFYDCSSLTSIVLPSGITAIPDYCFLSCTSLASVDIPSVIKTIGKSAFYLCKALTEFQFSTALTSIGRYAFSGTGLETLTLGDGVSIESYAFSGCSRLETAILPSDLTSLPSYVFQGCKTLTTIGWPSALQKIDEGAFSDCSFANNDYILELPATVTSIGANAFGYLHYLTIPSTSPVSVASDAFVQYYTYLMVPEGMVEMYKVRANWSKYADYITPMGTYLPDLEVGGAIGEAVDLGLPSGLKWASWNVGAYAPEEYGSNFSWGEVNPKWDYTNTYKWVTYIESEFRSLLTKYNGDSSNGTVDNKTILDMEDDAAHANWGSSWRMPTDAEWTELENNCTWTWMTQNGANGYLVTGSNGNCIFLPAAGCRKEMGLEDAGTNGYYWSSSLDVHYPFTAKYMKFNSKGPSLRSLNRTYGFSVRPVTE